MFVQIIHIASVHRYQYSQSTLRRIRIVRFLIFLPSSPPLNPTVIHFPGDAIFPLFVLRTLISLDQYVISELLQQTRESRIFPSSPLRNNSTIKVLRVHCIAGRIGMHYAGTNYLGQKLSREATILYQIKRSVLQASSLSLDSHTNVSHMLRRKVISQKSPRQTSTISFHSKQFALRQLNTLPLSDSSCASHKFISRACRKLDPRVVEHRSVPSKITELHTRKTRSPRVRRIQRHSRSTQPSSVTVLSLRPRAMAQSTSHQILSVIETREPPQRSVHLL